MATELRRFADDFAHIGSYPDATSNPHESTLMPRLSIPHPLPCHTDRTTFQRTERASGFTIAAALVTSISLALCGCSTPVVKPSVDVPSNFAAGTASKMEPEAAWWEVYHDRKSVV